MKIRGKICSNENEAKICSKRAKEQFISKQVKFDQEQKENQNKNLPFKYKSKIAFQEFRSKRIRYRVLAIDQSKPLIF